MSVDGRGGAEDDVLQIGHEVEVERLWRPLHQQRLLRARRRLLRCGRGRWARGRRIEPFVFQNAAEGTRKDKDKQTYLNLNEGNNFEATQNAPIDNKWQETAG